MQVDAIEIIEKTMFAHGIQTLRIKPPYDDFAQFDYGLRQAIDPDLNWNAMGQRLLEMVPNQTIAMVEGIFGMQFLFFRLPDQDDAFLSIGPWIRKNTRPDKKLCALLEIDAASLRIYFDSVRVVNSDLVENLVYSVLSSAYPDRMIERIQLYEPIPRTLSKDGRFLRSLESDDPLPFMLVEKRSRAENRILHAVMIGDTDSAIQEIAQYGRYFKNTPGGRLFYKSKRQAIALNALMRKAVEQADVHAYYADRIAMKYDGMIDGIDSFEAEQRVLFGMAREYCTCVHMFCLKAYSPLIRKVISYIDINLSAALTQNQLAAICGVTPSYLCNTFKEETGQTIIEYINTKRIQRAAKQLEITNEQIVTIAMEVGFVDVNYFSRLFKRQMGMTPTQYRRSCRKTVNAKTKTEE